MNLPYTLKIGYRDYAVDYLPTAVAVAGAMLGQCDTRIPEISVREGLTDLDTAQVLLHELFHAIWDSGCLHTMEPTEETVVSVLSNGFMQVWRDNPDLREFLILAV